MNKISKTVRGSVVREQGGPIRFAVFVYENKKQIPGVTVNVRHLKNNDVAMNGRDWERLSQKIVEQLFKNGDAA